MTDTYSDFARWLSKRTEEELAELRSEEPEISWKPRPERVVNYHTRVKQTMLKLYDRAADITCVRLGVNDRPSTSLEDHSTRLVMDLVWAIERDVVSFVAGRTETGTALSQLVREEFENSTRADRIARSTAEIVFNLAQLDAADTAEIEQVQVLSTDAGDELAIGVGACVSVADARNMNGPGGVAFRLLKKPVNIRHESTEDGLLARYDAESSTVLFDIDITADDEQTYMLAVGEALAI